MSDYSLASEFQLKSVDHGGRDLLSTEVHSIKNLLGESGTPYNTPERLQLSFTHGEREFSFELFKEAGPISSEVKIRKGDGSVQHGVSDEQQHSVYYSSDRSALLAFHNHGKFEGLVLNEMIHFSSEQGKLKVNGGFEGLPFGRKLQDGPVHWDNCHSAQNSGLMHVNFGGVLGWEFLQRYGDDALATFSSMIALTNGVYEAQMDMAFEVKELYYSSDTDAFSSVGCTKSINEQMDRLREWGRPNNQAVWHLIDHCFGSTGSTSGIGYMSTACVDGWNYGVTYTADQYEGWLTLAHELGHNFAAQHSFEEGQGSTGGIMDYGDGSLDGIYQFNTQYRKTEMCNYIQSYQWCPHFEIGAAPPPVPTPAPTNAEVDCGWFWCRDAPEVEIKINELECVKTRNKAIKSNQGERLEKVVVEQSLQECKESCFTNEKCKTFTFNEKTGFCDLMTEKTEADLYHLAGFDTYFCSDNMVEALRSTPSEDDNLGVLSVEDLSVLEETCCVATSNAIYPGMNYMFLAGETEKSCRDICLKESTCTAVGFEKETNNCIFWNIELEKSAAVSKSDSIDLLTCNRGCISGHLAGGENGSEVELASASIAGTGVAVFVGLFAVGLTKLMRGSK